MDAPPTGNADSATLMVEMLGFELTVFSVDGEPFAFRERGRRPVLRSGFPRPEDRRQAWTARALDLLDWGAPREPAPRLGEDAFYRAYDAAHAASHLPFDDPEPSPEPSGWPRGLARHCALGPSGFGLVRADTPDDFWVGDPACIPLARVGYWGGTPERRVWLGPTSAAVKVAMRCVYDADYAAWGCSDVAGLPVATSTPTMAPPDPFDILLVAYTTGTLPLPGDELCVVIDGEWVSGITAQCVLCGAPTDLQRHGAGEVHLCAPCRLRALVALVARAKQMVEEWLARDPATITPDEWEDLRRFGKTGEELLAWLHGNARHKEAGTFDAPGIAAESEQR